MGKLFGQSPSSYFNIQEYEVRWKSAIDLACASAYWEDENYHYLQSKETASNEAGAISDVLDNYKKQLAER